MKIIVAGGRKFNNKAFMIKSLDELVDDGVIPEDTELVCGMAPGADLTAKDIFEEAGLVVHERPAAWKDLDAKPCVVKRNRYGLYNALAGHNRNHSMGDEAKLAVIFWDGKSTGSKDMIDYMKKLGKPVYVIRY